MMVKMVLVEGETEDTNFEEFINDRLYQVMKSTGKEFPYNRVDDLPKFIKEHAVGYRLFKTESYAPLSAYEEYFGIDKDLIIKLKEEGRYLIRGRNKQRVVLRVVDVDTDRKWFLREGRVVYYKEVCLHKPLNMHKVIEF